jgi:hypothetical protein
LWAGDEFAASSLYTDGSRGTAASRAEDLASRLAGDGGAEAGLEVLASCIAVASVQQTALASLFGELVRKKDLDSARTVSHLLKMSSDRLARLSEAHSAALARGARPVVVASAGQQAGLLRIAG